LECIIKTATGNWLNYWGEWFGIPRHNNEDDPTYRDRLLYAITKSKTTPNSFIEAAKNILGANVDVQVYEPYVDLAKYNISTYNGSSKFQGGNYYNYNIADIIIQDTVITPELIEEIQKIKAAGVYVYFTHGLQFGVVDSIPGEPRECVELETDMEADRIGEGVYKFDDPSTMSFPMSGEQSLYYDVFRESQLKGSLERVIFPGSVMPLSYIADYTPQQLDAGSDVQNSFEVEVTPA
jgi:hypothetical protein